MPILPAPASPTHDIGGTLFTSLATPTSGSTDTSGWLVQIPPGTAGTPHRLTREEIFVILAGRATVHLDGRLQSAGEGDAIVVPPGVPFMIEPDGDESLRAVCCLPVGGQAQLPGGQPFTPPWVA